MQVDIVSLTSSFTEAAAEELLLSRGGGMFVGPVPQVFGGGDPQPQDPIQPTNPQAISTSIDLSAAATAVFEIEHPQSPSPTDITNTNTNTGCTSNSDCCTDCVCIVRLHETLDQLVAWAGNFILGCVARSAINPRSGRDRGGGAGEVGRKM